MRPRALTAVLAAALAVAQTAASSAADTSPAATLVTVATAPDAPASPASTPVVPGPAPSGGALPESKPSEPRVMEDASLVLVLGGDIGLGGSNQPVHPGGAIKNGTRHAWQELTAGIRPLIDGDVNFANLETVVTDRNDLRASPKAFNFRSHPDGVRHLVGLGFNVFSTANNHALDYGEAGVRETLRNLETLKAQGLAAWPGVGVGHEHASRPAEIVAKGARIRVSAIGIGGNGVGSSVDRAGMVAFNAKEDFRLTVSRLSEAPGDFKILSVHYGSELQVRPDSSEVHRLRDEAVKVSNIDIVVGHHAHVAAGVQLVDGKLVLYGLGNLLHPGMQDMGRMNVCRDFGLVARVHVARDVGGRLRTRAIEAIPLTDMHLAAKPLAGEEGRTRIEVLNQHASGLDDAAAGASGVRFVPRPDGTGLHCLPGAADEPGRIGALCRGWTPPEPPSASVARRIAGACGSGVHIAQRRHYDDDGYGERPRRGSLKQARKSKSTIWNVFGAW